MSRAKTEIDIPNSNGTGGRPIETLNWVGDDGPQGFKVGTLRGDMIRGTGVKNKGTFGCPGKKNSQDARQDGRSVNIDSGVNWRLRGRAPVHGRLERTIDSKIGVIRVSC